MFMTLIHLTHLYTHINTPLLLKSLLRTWVFTWMFMTLIHLYTHINNLPPLLKSLLRTWVFTWMFMTLIHLYTHINNLPPLLKSLLRTWVFTWMFMTLIHLYTYINNLPPLTKIPSPYLDGRRSSVRNQQPEPAEVASTACQTETGSLVQPGWVGMRCLVSSPESSSYLGGTSQAHGWGGGRETAEGTDQVPSAGEHYPSQQGSTPSEVRKVLCEGEIRVIRGCFLEMDSPGFPDWKLDWKHPPELVLV